MKKKLKKWLSISLMGAIMISLCGCYDRKEIDDFAYVIAIGFDVGQSNQLRMTLQMASPKSMGGESEGVGGDKEKSESKNIAVVETPNIYAGLNLMNNYVSKQINLSHTRVIVFSEALAREGLTDYIRSMIRGREFRGNMHVLVSKGLAEDYIKNAKADIEENMIEYYESNQESYQYTAFTPPSRLFDFYQKMNCTCVNPVATLAGVGKYDRIDEVDMGASTYQSKGRAYPLEGDFIAGQIPKSGNVNSEIMGLGVFVGGKLVGVLDGQDTVYYLMVMGQYNHSFMSIPLPENQVQQLQLNIIQSRKPLSKVRMENDKPKIEIKIKLEADILAIPNGKDYESTENVETIERMSESFIKSDMEKMLMKVTKEYRSDIFGFGKQMKFKSLTWDQWIKLEWMKKFEASTYSVDVDVKVRRPGLIIRTVDIPEKKEKAIE